MCSFLELIPWESRNSFGALLRTKRKMKRLSNFGSIMAECCTHTGCTWEEYAEYCPSNKRINAYRSDIEK